MGGSSIGLGVGSSAVAAVLLSVGTIVQAHDARLVDRSHGMRLSLLARLLSRRRWVLGTAVGYLAFPFQLLALAYAPLVIVQPVHAIGLILLLIAGVRLFREHFHLADVLGAIAIVIGLSLMTSGAPTGPNPPTSEAALGGTTGALLLVAVVPYFFRERTGKHVLIVSAAVGFAATNLAVKGISYDLATHNYVIGVSYLVAAAVGSTVGVLSQMTAFQRHRAVDVAPITFSLPTFLPVALGLVILRERWSTAAAGGLLFAIGGAFVLIGALAVARSPAVIDVAAAVPQPAGGAPPNTPKGAQAPDDAGREMRTGN